MLNIEGFGTKDISGYCSYCGRDVQFIQNVVDLGVGDENNYDVVYILKCPNSKCKHSTYILDHKIVFKSTGGGVSVGQGEPKLFFPEVNVKIRTFVSVPKRLTDLYNEANRIFEISNKFAGAAFRICLEETLCDVGYKKGMLNEKIQKYLTDKTRFVPQSIRDHIAHLQKLGNMCSHSAEDILGNKIKFTDEEINYCRTILEMIFDQEFTQVNRLNNISSQLTTKDKQSKAAQKNTKTKAAAA